MAESKHSFAGYEIASVMVDKLQTSHTEEEAIRAAVQPCGMKFGGLVTTRFLVMASQMPEGQ